MKQTDTRRPSMASCCVNLPGKKESFHFHFVERKNFCQKSLDVGNRVGKIVKFSFQGKENMSETIKRETYMG
jgi:hypothetical protein